jgi:hypothetical protein
MSLDDKKTKRLAALLESFDEGAVQPEDLNQALEAVMTVIESANRELDQRINKSSENATGALSALENRVSQATSELQALIRQVKAEETADKAELRKMVAAELLRIESKIPQIPEQFDATELYNDIQSHKEMLTGLSELIVGENIRNALEALPEGEKLVMEAIEGLPELLEKLSQMEGKGNVVGGVTRALVEQLIAESGGGSSLPDQTGNAGKFLGTDGTDASWETVSAGSVDVVSNVATDRILGRTTAGTGDSEQLTASAVRTLINVEDGATADQDLSGLVSKTGNETVAGVKTFSSSPIIPAPSTDLQAATKKYVDDNAGGTVDVVSAKFVKLTTTSTADANSSSEMKVAWDTLEIDEKDDAITHSVSTNNSRITLDQNGYYRGFVNIGFSGSTTRGAPRVRVKVNNTTYLPEEARHTYLRATSNHNDSSANFSFVVEADAGDYIEVTSVQGAAFGTLNIDGASLTIEKYEIGKQGEKGDTGATGTVDFVSNVATATILGRDTAGAGNSEELSPSATRTLLNVEDGADVTDTTNVTDAGALMESEVINLAQVKAFDSTDYAAALGADDNYVTDAEKTVIGNTSGTNTGDQDLSALAAKANVLELNNTTAFTPDADYEPATKKYVDDNGGGGDLWGDPVDADIIPDGDKTRDLGNGSVQFGKIYGENFYMNGDISFRGPYGTVIKNEYNKTLLEINHGAPFRSDVENSFYLQPSDTGVAPQWQVQGSDTNISLNLVPKGTGKVQANGVEVATVRGAVNAQTGTTYTLVIGDEYLDGVRMTNASANTLTIPPNADVALPVGTKVFITQGGAGSTTIAAGAGVTINTPSTVTLAIGEQYESRVCQKISTDTWLLI